MTVTAAQVAPDEASRVADVVERLRRRFSTIDGLLVAKVVDHAYHELDGAVIRDFVLILVEKQAREVLEQESRWLDA